MYATPSEVLTALQLLSAGERLRLHKAARVMVRGTTFSDPVELVTDAMHTAYLAAGGDRGRRWKTDVPFVAYLMVTIRGIASDSRRSLRTHPALRHAFDPGAEALGSEVMRSSALVAASIEVTAADEEERRRLEAQEEAYIDTTVNFFKDDTEVAWIIRGVQEGMRSQKIQALSGMTRIQHAAAHRRWRRGLQRLFPWRRTI